MISSSPRPVRVEKRGWVDDPVTTVDHGVGSGVCVFSLFRPIGWGSVSTKQDWFGGSWGQRLFGCTFSELPFLGYEGRRQDNYKWQDDPGLIISSFLLVRKVQRVVDPCVLVWTCFTRVRVCLVGTSFAHRLLGVIRETHSCGLLLYNAKTPWIQVVCRSEHNL